MAKARSVFAAHWFIASPAPQPYQAVQVQDRTRSARQGMCAPAEKIPTLAGDGKVLSNDFCSLPTPLIDVAIFLATDLNNMFRQR